MTKKRSYLNNTSLPELSKSSDRHGTRTMQNSSIVKGHKGLVGCQIQTPLPVVRLLWDILGRHRDHFGSVVDFGSGDGRFAIGGNYGKYVGIEIDNTKCPMESLPPNVELVNDCAFNFNDQFNTAVGNPPYVRHHDIDSEWKKNTVALIKKDTGFTVNELCNMFVYFIWLSLLRTKPDGLIGIIVPYEWVSRPSVLALRKYIHENEWHVDVYKFCNGKEIFPQVLTTASITVIDKQKSSNHWSYYDINEHFKISKRRGITASGKTVLPYIRGGPVRAQRGLSPGSQKVFTLTEGERIHHGIRLSEVVPCVTSFRNLPSIVETLDRVSFKKYFIDAGRKCWLLITEGNLRKEVLAYLDSAPVGEKKRWTCMNRDIWYQYKLPSAPRILCASGFVRFGPKVVRNEVSAMAVGSVHGIISEDPDFNAVGLVKYLRKYNFESRVVPYARALKKIEVNQMNWVLNRYSSK